jgi:3-oxoacyl-[acyl-carrier protein] reductase
MVSEVERELGPVETLVLNAAIGFPIRPFVDYAWADFQAKLVGELGAAFFCCKAVVPGMIARRGGSIVAVSSGLSRHAGGGFCAHSTAKAGLDALMRSLALELGPSGIRVNVVGPGLTETDATAGLPPQAKEYAARAAPLRRVATPEDVAGAVLMLASDHLRFVTGAYVPVSGGSLML